jgi:hypothetical protein
MAPSADSPAFLSQVLNHPPLLCDPGATMRLLQECYALDDAGCLAPLLGHENARVVANSVWIVGSSDAVRIRSDPSWFNCFAILMTAFAIVL